MLIGLVSFAVGVAAIVIPHNFPALSGWYLPAVALLINTVLFVVDLNTYRYRNFARARSVPGWGLALIALINALS